jgi:hypothetical protein
MQCLLGCVPGNLATWTYWQKADSGTNGDELILYNGDKAALRRSAAS